MLRSIKCDCHCDQESNMVMVMVMGMVSVMVMVMVMVHIRIVGRWKRGRGGNSPPLGRWGGGGIPSPGVEIPPLRDTEVGGKSPPGGDFPTP